MATNVRKLLNAMPVLNKKIVEQQKAAKAIQLQQAAKQQPAAPAQKVAPAAQTLGAKLGAISAQQNLQNTQTNQQLTSALGSQALGQEQLGLKKGLAEKQLGLGEKQLAANKELEQKQLEIEDQAFKNRTAFLKDELGRTEFQQTQAMDLAMVMAKDEEDFKNKAQIVHQETEKSINVLVALQNNLKTYLSGKFKVGEQRLDIESRKRIQQAINDLNNTIAKRKADAQSMRAMASGAGTVAGGVIGAIYGGPAGAAAGATVGGAAGETVGGAIS